MKFGGRPARFISSLRSRKISRVTGVVTCVVVAVTGIVVVAGLAAGTPDRASGQHRDLVLTAAGAVVDGAKVFGTIQVKAPDVRIVNSLVRSGGENAVEIAQGITGTVVEDTEIRCESATTDGLAWGNYTARRVRVVGCEKPFVSSPEAPATIENSTWNGQPFTPDSGNAAQPGQSDPDGTGGMGNAQPGTSGSKPTSGGNPTVRTGFPGPGNTGVPPGTQLSTYTGPTKLDKAGTVIDGKVINSCLQVHAERITIRRSKIVCGGDSGGGVPIVRIFSGSITIEDTEMDGKNVAFVIGFENYTLRRVNMHHINEGPRVDTNVVIEDSWIHSLIRTNDEDHQDVLQTTEGNNSRVVHNTLDAYNAAYMPNPWHNAAYMIGTETGAKRLHNLLVENNLMIGGAYTLNVRDDGSYQNVVFRGNRFVRNARYGPCSVNDGNSRRIIPGVSFDRSNVFDDSGKPVLDA